jgi:hypothetical protein
LTRIAKAAGATFIPSTSVGLRRYYGPNGEHTSADDSALVYQKVWEYSDAAVEYSRDYNVGSNKSMADFCSTRLTEDKDLDSDERRHLVEDGLEMLAGIAACDLDKMSLKYYWMEEDLPVSPSFTVLQAGRQTFYRLFVCSHCGIYCTTFTFGEPR